MAKTPVSDEELHLKKKARRRLVGAIVLVLLVVVFVPMFLDREPRRQKQDIDIRIPPIPGQAQPPQTTSPQILPPAAQESNPSEQPASAPPAPERPQAAAATPPATDTAAAPAPAVPAPPEPSAAAGTPSRPDEASSESFVIQLGAFSDPANARHLLEKLQAQNIPAYAEAVKTAQGEKTRVRAGPYPTMTTAENGRARLQKLKLLPGRDAQIVHKGE